MQRIARLRTNNDFNPIIPYQPRKHTVLSGISTMSEDLPYFFISSFFEPMSAPSAKMSKR